MKASSTATIASFAESNGESIGNDGILREDVVTEVYYLPEEYVVKQGLLNDKHSTLTLLDASEEEQQSVFQGPSLLVLSLNR